MLKSFNPICENCLIILTQNQIGTSNNTKQKNSLYFTERLFFKETKEKLSSSIHQARDGKKKKTYKKKHYQANREKILNYIKKRHMEDYQHYWDYNHKRKLERIDMVFEFFIYSVDFLNEIERNVRIFILLFFYIYIFKNHNIKVLLISCINE